MSEYYYTMDPFPQQTAEFTKLHEFYDRLREGQLVTRKCSDCGFVGWPPRPVCPNCMSDRMGWVELPQEGTISSFTVQENGIPQGYEPPLIFALVDVGPVRVLTRIVDSPIDKLKIGVKVALKVLQVPDSPFSKNRVIPAFTLSA